MQVLALIFMSAVIACNIAPTKTVRNHCYTFHVQKECAATITRRGTGVHFLFESRIVIDVLNRGAGSMLALVRCLTVYIVMLALCKEALAMLVLKRMEVYLLIYSEVWGGYPSGKFGSLGFLRSFLVQFRGKITC